MDKKLAKILHQSLKDDPSKAIILQVVDDLEKKVDKEVKDIKESIPYIKDGYTPIKDVDYFDGETPSNEKLSELIKPLIPVIKDGNDYVLTDEDKMEIALGINVPIVEKVIEKVEVIRETPIVTNQITNEIKEVAITDEPLVIAGKLNTLKEAVDDSVIKGFPDLKKRIELSLFNPTMGPSFADLENIKTIIKNLPAPNYPVTSVSNSDSTLTISPTTGAVIASLNLSHANTWTGQQTFGTSAPIFSTMTAGSVLFVGTSGLLSQDNSNLFWDNTNKLLGVDTNSPLEIVSVGVSTFAPFLYFDGHNGGASSQNTFLNVSSSVTGSSSVVIGLNLENSSQTNNTYSPLITFSRLSDSGAFNMPYAYIAGQRTGIGEDTNWNGGDITFGTSPVGVNPSYMTERMRIYDTGIVGIGSKTDLLSLEYDASNTAGSIQVYQTNGTTVAPLLLNSSGGNVGIGTTAPVQRFDLKDGNQRMTIDTSTPTTPSATLAGIGAGNVDNGVHVYLVAYLTAGGGVSYLSIASSSVNVTNNAVNGQVTVTIPVSTNSAVTGRRIWRTIAGQTNTFWMYQLADVNNNTSTTYTDNISDATMTANKERTGGWNLGNAGDNAGSQLTGRVTGNGTGGYQVDSNGNTFFYNNSNYPWAEFNASEQALVFGNPSTSYGYSQNSNRIYTSYDRLNGGISALYITSAGRVFIGDYNNIQYSLNLLYCQRIENYPAEVRHESTTFGGPNISGSLDYNVTGMMSFGSNLLGGSQVGLNGTTRGVNWISFENGADQFNSQQVGLTYAMYYPGPYVDFGGSPIANMLHTAWSINKAGAGYFNAGFTRTGDIMTLSTASVWTLLYDPSNYLSITPDSSGNATFALTGTTPKFTFSNDLKLGTVGTGLYVKEGTNATMGVATLSAGTVVVSTTKVTANSRIFLTIDGGTLTNVGATYVSARTAGTSFTISSTNILDASNVSWIIIEPA